MADDSDIDSWYPKHDEIGRAGSALSSNSKFGNQAIPKSSRSGTEVRFINPAIYAESATQPDFIVEVRCGDSNDIENGLSALSVTDQESDTYRCRSETSTLTLTNDSKSVTRVVRRNLEDEQVRRFSLDGRRVVQFSSTSLSCGSSCSDSRTTGLTLARKIAHEEWVQKKHRAARQKEEAERRADAIRKAKEEREERERVERERRERENFIRWEERKKIDEANRKLAVERELDLQRRLKAVEEQVAVAKIVHLQQWARKKEEAQKAQQKEQEIKRKAIAEERKKRLEQSSQAFEKWREISKGRPRPATQGLLPHQRAKPSFVNPEPWQRIVDDEPIEVPKNSTNKGKSKVRRIIASHQ